MIKALGVGCLAFFVVITVGLRGLDLVGVVRPGRGIFETVFLPVHAGLFAFRQDLESVALVLTFWRSGEARIRNLEQRNLELLAQRVESANLIAENEMLRKQLGVVQTVSRKLLYGRVTGAGRFLEIAVGEKEGVKEGDTVVYLNNLIGRVVEVGPRWSLVMMATDVESKVPAVVGGISGLAVGRFNLGILLTKLSQVEELEEGAEVVTSGEGRTFVPGLLIGRVTRVTGGQADLFKEAIVEPFVNYSSLREVFVVLE